MIRDFDLIRKILLEAQVQPADAVAFTVSFQEYDQSVVDAHSDLLIEAGLLKGKTIRAMSGIIEVTITGLTWAGHDFIAAAQEEPLWEKAKKLIKEKGAALTFEVLKEAVKRLSFGDL